MTRDSGYRILSILLIESHFKRLPTIQKPAERPVPVLDVQFDSVIENENIRVVVTASLSLKGDDSESAISAEVTMIGRFQIFGEPELPHDKFADVNAPAIIYPFIREHMANLSQKAGVGQVLIPPLNFTRKPRKKKKPHPEKDEASPNK